MAALLRSPFRETVRGLVRIARESLVIACPFIHKAEMEMVCSEVKASSASLPHLHVLTQVRAGSVLDGSLEISALVAAHESLGALCKITHLPRLHAKLYVADSTAAIVTSANLTRAGLDLNYEYGVLITESSLVTQLHQDIESFAAVGNQITTSDLYSLQNAADELCHEYQRSQRSLSSSVKRRFDRILRRTETEFLGTLVGIRTKNALFSQAILYALHRGPLSTEGIHQKVRDLLPDLCDDSKELVIRGERFGKVWKHDVRNAQQALKRRGQLRFEGAKWHLVGLEATAI
jgi:hypothetical protein